MLTAEKQNELLAIVRETLGQSYVKGVDSADTKILKVDSLGILDLMLALEDHFGCNVDPERFAGCVTMGDLMRIVEEATP
jgi:acyl carrier protein